MNYKLGDKIIRIPDKEIEHSMTTLKISKKDAIKMYLEDEGYLENEEQEALEKKAKENRITATIHEAKKDSPKKTQKERTQKDDPTKERIIKECAEVITQLTGNTTIVNKTKLIDFEFEGEKYELNLIRKRKPKEK